MELKKPLWFYILLAGLVLVFGYHLAVIMHYSLDVPTNDEWSVFWPNRLSKAANPSWWIEAHNEHRIVWTKIQIWILYLVNGWNLTFHKVVNFLIYGSLLVALYRFLTKRLPKSSLFLLPFFLFPLCTLPYENHTWGFQSCFHFVLLLLLGCAAWLFSENPTPKNRVVAIVLGLGALVSFASGVPGVFVLVAVYGLSNLLWREKRRRTEVFLTCAILMIGVAAWLYYYQPVSGHPQTSYPWSYQFWSFLANSISLGFGVRSISFSKSIIYLALIGIPWIVLALRNRGNLSSKQWSVVAFLLAIVGMLAVVGMGRAGSNLGNSKISRYTEFSLMLVPITAAVWLCILGEKQRPWFAIAFFALLAINHRNHFNYKSVYREVYSVRTDAKTCVDNYFLRQNKDSMHCPGIYPWELSAGTTWRAWELEPSFIRKLKKQSPPLADGVQKQKNI